VADDNDNEAKIQHGAQRVQPSFSAPFWAAWRQGLKELGQALPAFPDSIRPVEELGTMGNPTQAMVTQEIGTFPGYQAMFDSYANRTPGHDNDERGMER
jgi:hypothetical protein